MIRRKKQQSNEIKGVVGKNCCWLINNKVIKNEKPSKIYREIYIYYPE